MWIWTAWRSTTWWKRTYKGLRGARLVSLVSLVLRISLAVSLLPGACCFVFLCCLFVFCLVLVGFLLLGKFLPLINFKSDSNSSSWPTMSRTAAVAITHSAGVCVNFSLLVSGSSLRDLHGRAITHSH